jgi:hypothetical protein
MAFPLRIAAIASLVLSACATVRLDPQPPGTPETVRASLAKTAEDWIGRRELALGARRFSNDCVGFVKLVYAANGIDVAASPIRRGDNGVTAIYDFTQTHGVLHRDGPQTGDLVFFHDTYDRNGDGVVNDGLTHVGIVDFTYPDGTVEVIHRVSRGVVRYRMNVDHPLDRTRDGRVINDFLRRGRDGHSVTAGTLFAAYGTVVR